MHISDLREAFAESDLPFQVDIVDWGSASENFRKIIEKEYAVVQPGMRKEPLAPDKWSKKSLSDVADPIMGQSPPSSTYNEIGDGLPFFQGVRDFNYRHPSPRIFCSKPSRIAQSGDILFSVRAPIGRVNIANRKCAIGRGLAIIRPHKKSDARYLEFLLRHMKTNWDVIEGSGSVFGNATKQDLKMLPLLWPHNKHERNTIAQILGNLDDKIELNKQMSKTLELMVQALFKSWFVDFDPVHVKMEGRQHRSKSFPSLQADLWDLFPSRLMNSRLGQIPHGWRVATFNNIAMQTREQENPTSSPNTLFSHFSIPAFDDGQTPKLEYGKDIKSTKLKVFPGTVLLSKLNPEIERVWLVDTNIDEKAVCSTEFLVLRACSPFTRSYIYCLLRSPLFQKKIKALVTGTSKSHQRVHADAILSLGVIFPPEPVVEAFDLIASKLLNRVLSCRSEINAIGPLSDTLLPKLISRELRVL